jgi:hypothetical protein
MAKAIRYPSTQPQATEIMISQEAATFISTAIKTSKHILEI